MKQVVSIWAIAALLLTGGMIRVCGATNYWDNNGDTAGFGTAGGVWGTESKWSVDSTGASVPAVTDTTIDDDLIFGTATSGLAAGTITVNGINQAFRSMTFGAASGVITLSNGTLNLAAPVSAIAVNNTSNTIASVLAGTNGLGLYIGVDTVYTNYLTTSFVTLFPNTVLSHYTGIAAIMNGAAIGRVPGMPFFYSNSGTNATVQIQAYSGGYTKCVKIELVQSGADIVGRAVYAKYNPNGLNVLGFDFDTGGTTVGVATSDGSYNYGVCETRLVSAHLLSLTGVNTYSGSTTIGSGTLEIGGGGQLGGGVYTSAIINAGQFIYNSTSNQIFSGPLSGSGSLVKQSPGKVSTLIAYTNFLPATPTTATVVPSAWLAECTGADGIIGGGSIGGGNSTVPADAYFFTNTGANVTYQLQRIDGNWLKCVKVELLQSGTNVVGRVLYAKYVEKSNPLGYNFDLGGNVMNIATAINVGGYGAAQTVLTFMRHPTLTLSGVNSYIGGTVVSGGQLEATGNASALSSAGPITVNAGGELVLKVAGLAVGNIGGVGNGNPITVNSGGTLTLAAFCNIGQTRSVTLDGGTLNSIITEAGDSCNYVNNLTLKNGAKVIGYQLRTGYFNDSTYVAAGTNASSIDAGINMVNGDRGQPIALTFNVADVTGNALTDLFVPGVIRDYNTGPLSGLPMIKTGAGTLEFSGVNTHVGPITIAAGTLALQTNLALNVGNPITLSGGTLAMGAFTNAVGTLTVVSNSVIALGEGQLAFADSSTTNWANALTLTGTLEAHTLRFGTNATALTSAQLAAIKLNGGHVILKSDGYLAPGPKGMLIYVH